jgi:transposase
MSRRPPEDRGAVITWHKQGLTPAEICRKTGFDHHFVTRWIAKYNDSGSLDDAKRAGRPRKLSKSVEQTVERKMRRKRRRSSRVIARELKRQKVCDVSYMTVQTNSASSRFTRFQTTENLTTVSSSQARPIAVRQD